MLSRVQVVLLEFWATKSTFEEYEYKMHRSTISSIVLRFEDVFVCLAYEKIVVWSFSIVLRWKRASEVDLELMSIVLRFWTSYYDLRVIWFFPIKAKLISEARVRNFREKRRLLELDHWAEGGRPSKLIAGY